MLMRCVHHWVAYNFSNLEKRWGTDFSILVLTDAHMFLPFFFFSFFNHAASERFNRVIDRNVAWSEMETVTGLVTLSESADAKYCWAPFTNVSHLVAFLWLLCDPPRHFNAYFRVFTACIIFLKFFNFKFNLFNF